MSRKARFRPTVETLETRRCMAAAIGDVAATPEEPARDTGGIFTITVTVIDDDTGGPVATIDDVTIDGNTANQEGGGLWNHGSGALKVPASVTDGGDGNDTLVAVQTNAPFDVAYPRGSDVGNATDAFFSELGDDTGDGVVPTEQFSFNFEKIPAANANGTERDPFYVERGGWDTANATDNEHKDWIIIESMS